MRLSDFVRANRPQSNSKRRAQKLRKHRRRLFMESLEDRRLLAMTNPGFESGFSGWATSVATGGNASVVSSHAEQGGGTGTTYFPQQGSRFALLESGAEGIYTRLSQTFSASSGEQIRGRAFFDTGDYLPYNDDGYLRILQNNVVLFNANVATVGDRGQTPWTTWTYTVPSSGTYTLEAAVRNIQDSGVSSYLGLDTINSPPIAIANGPYSVSEGGSVVLSSAGSNDPDGSINLYQWDLNYTGTFTVDSTSSSPSFSAASIDGNTSRTVALRVRDNDGAFSSIDTAVVNIANVPPTINSVTNTGPVNEGSSVSVSVSATDPIDPLLYEFDFDNNGVYEVGPITSNSASHVFADDGTYPVNVRVTDGDGGVDTSSTVVTVNNAAPKNLVVAVTPTINENEVAVVTGSFADPGVEDAHKITVDWDDPNNATDSFFDLPATNTLAVNDTFTSSDGAELTITSVNTSTGAIGFSVEDHQYLDDGDSTLGNGTPSDLSNVLVTVEDVTGVLFAITQNDIVAEQLPYGPTVIDESDSAFVSTVNAGVVHNSWTQIVTSDGSTELFTIDWQFSSTKTLEQRFIDAVATGEAVTWTVTSSAFGTQVYNGTWRFSNSAGDMASRFAGTSADPDFSNDDGIWGGGNGIVDGNGGSDSNVAWGHSNWQSGDSSDRLYQNGVISSPSAGFKNFMYVDGGGSGSAVTASATVNVVNVPPTASLDVVPDIDENGNAALTGSFTDPGLLDKHNVTVDWDDPNNATDSTFALDATNSLAASYLSTSGDGAVLTISGVNLSTGQVDFSVQHQYLDDGVSASPWPGGNGSPSDTSTISLTVSDDDGGTAGGSSPSVLIDFSSGVYSGSGTYSEDGFTFSPQNPVNHTDCNNSSNPYFCFHDGSANTAPNFIEVSQGGTPFTLSSFDTLDVFGTNGLPLTLTNSNGDTFSVSTAGTHSPPIGQNWTNITSFTMRANPNNFTVVVDNVQFGGGQIETTFTVNNVAPVVALGSVADIDENGTATLTGSFTDIGLSDSHRLTVNWADPNNAVNSVFELDDTNNLLGSYSSTDGATLTITGVNLSTGQVDFSVQHQYLDDGASGSPWSGANGSDADSTTINVLVEDDDDESGEADTTFTVNNVAPVVALGTVADIDENGTATLTGSFTDIGLSDSHRLTVDWDDPNNAVNSVFELDDTNNLLGSYSSTDGATLTITGVNLSTGQVDFSVQHQYLDDGASGSTWPGANGSDADSTTINVLVEDDDDESGEADTTFTVNNVAPVVALGTVADIDENGTATLTGSFTDIGLSDSHRLTVNWADPNNAVNSVFELDDTNNLLGSYSSTDGATLTITGVNLSTGQVDFSVQHQYLDDGASGSTWPGANGSDADDSTISVLVEDDDAENGDDDSTFTVSNVAPTINGITSGAEKCGSAHEDDPITLTGMFTDPGLSDVHEVEIDWGDANEPTNSTFELTATGGLTVGDMFNSTTDDAVLTITAVDSTGKVSFAVDNDYATGGIFTIIVTVSDDDTGAAAPASTLAVVSGVGLQNGVLQIIGTSEDDHVSLNQTGNGTLKVHADFIPEDALGETRNFVLANVDRIFMLLCDGDDHATVSGRITLDTIIDGGDGDDHLNGGDGSNVILGRDGDDHINGGSGRDILIGGLGEDRIIGNPERDLISGGVLQNSATATTDSIADEDDILVMQERLKEATDIEFDEYRDGTDDVFAGLGLEIVDDAGEADSLTGSSADDWFLLFANDTATDANSNGNGNGGTNKGKGKK
ncbi:PKD domain-containing protein [Novipirellula caenicola]|uniref:PKD domain-containing protein n=1 Tax=Novipirellula caenicola TaxID=1536901 RepID=A0ABP9VTH8_9BACT